MIVWTHCNNFWYKIDDKNRIFRCSKDYKNKIYKTLLSSRDTKNQAIKLAEHFAREFNCGIAVGY
jgi:hypothetical protein